MRWSIINLIFPAIFLFVNCQGQSTTVDTGKAIIPGAEQTALYFPQLKGKRLGIVTNNTSLVGKTHLLDTLLSAGMKVSCIFSPEHGFRGTEDAGKDLSDSRDRFNDI